MASVILKFRVLGLTLFLCIVLPILIILMCVGIILIIPFSSIKREDTPGNTNFKFYIKNLKGDKIQIAAIPTVKTFISNLI
jgi:hypothetical protein